MRVICGQIAVFWVVLFFQLFHADISIAELAVTPGWLGTAPHSSDGVDIIYT